MQYITLVGDLEYKVTFKYKDWQFGLINSICARSWKYSYFHHRHFTTDTPISPSPGTRNDQL